jgi:hypothetical protein
MTDARDPVIASDLRYPGGPWASIAEQIEQGDAER